MFLVSFIFKPGVYDDEFHRLDASIDAFALTLPGYLGVERWVSQDGSSRNSIYHWSDMASIQSFSRFQEHIDAKKNYTNWYDGFQIVISEVKASYGDGNIPTLAKATETQGETA